MNDGRWGERGRDSFSDWLIKAAPPELQPWTDHILRLEMSWNSFRHREAGDLVSDLVAHGIPIMASRAIVSVVANELVQRDAPMAIFWDLKNMPIPSELSARNVAMRLKSTLASYGRSVQFRGYVSKGMDVISQYNRSELQLSGCQLVDCPSNGRKEVSDKMIIVDALTFAYAHPNAATLCFVTGDMDCAYLLSALQQKSRWRTVVVSKGSEQSILHINCDVLLSWERDVFQLTDDAMRKDPCLRLQSALDPTQHVFALPQDQDNGSPNVMSVLAADEVNLLLSVLRELPVAAGMEHKSNSDHCVLKSNAGKALRSLHPSRFINRDAVQLFLARAVSQGIVKEQGEGGTKILCAPKPLKIAFDSNDIEILREVMINLPCISSPFNAVEHCVLKSNTGSTLRVNYPSRFPNRDSVQLFLAKAIEAGIVIERGEGATKTLSFRISEIGSINSASKPIVKLADMLPITIEDVPQRVKDMTSHLPLILFVHWARCPKNNQFPSHTFVHSFREWAIVMFRTLADGQRAVETLPWLQHGVLVDWRKITDTASESQTLFQHVPRRQKNWFETAERGSCLFSTSSCELQAPARNTSRFENFFTGRMAEETSLSTLDAAFLIQNVVDLLHIMATNDDIYVAENIVRKQLVLRWPDECESALYASIWISEAVKSGKVISFRREGSKTKLLCLPSFYAESILPFPPETWTTEEEERFVIDILRKKNRWMLRSALTIRLVQAFDSMQKPLMRKKMYLNAESNGSFYVAKRHFGQTVGLTKQDAEHALNELAGEAESSLGSPEAASRAGSSTEEKKSGGQDSIDYHIDCFQDELYHRLAGSPLKKQTRESFLGFDNEFLGHRNINVTGASDLGQKSNNYHIFENTIF